MLIAHTSDLHGHYFPSIPENVDLIVDSGDHLPNLIRGRDDMKDDLRREIDANFQSWFIRDRIPQYQDWLKDKTIIFASGNHDWGTPTYILNQNGMRCIDANNRVVFHEGKSFYGFPYIPYIYGEWNYELQLPEMAEEIRKMKTRLREAGVEQLDCLIAHSPIANVLDLYEGKHVGNTLMANLFDYEWPKDQWPKAYLCGHIHEAHGIIQLDSMTISNAATTLNLVEI